MDGRFGATGLVQHQLHDASLLDNFRVFAFPISGVIIGLSDIPIPRLIVTTRILTCLGSGILMNKPTFATITGWGGHIRESEVVSAMRIRCLCQLQNPKRRWSPVLSKIRPWIHVVDRRQKLVSVWMLICTYKSYST